MTQTIRVTSNISVFPGYKGGIIADADHVPEKIVLVPALEREVLIRGEMQIAHVYVNRVPHTITFEGKTYPLQGWVTSKYHNGGTFGTDGFYEIEPDDIIYWLIRDDSFKPTSSAMPPGIMVLPGSMYAVLETENGKTSPVIDGFVFTGEEVISVMAVDVIGLTIDQGAVNFTLTLN